MNYKMLKTISLSLIFLLFFSTVSYAQVSSSDIEKYKQYLQNNPNQQMANPQSQQTTQQNQYNQPKEDRQVKKEPSDFEKYFNSSLTSEAGPVFLEQGINPVEQFGYDVFKDATSTFMPSTDTPVGPDYIVGPGDSFVITMWGISEGIFNVDVGRNGDIVLPKVGVVNVAGIRFGELQSFIEKQLTKYYEKVNVSVSIKNIRTIRVYVVGEVEKPGSYMVSSLSSLFSALISAGGPTKKGTMRDVRLLRNNRVIAHVDLYKFLLKGDRNQDRELQSGDTIFVPIIGSVVGITGNVYRPAIYEITGGDADLSDILRIAGGVLPTSYLNRVQVERVVAHQKKTILDKQVTFSSQNPRFYIPIQNMDLVKIYPIFSGVSNAVFLEGAVKYPGKYELKPDMAVRDLVNSKSQLQFGAYLPKAELIRIDKKSFQTQVYEIELSKLLSGDNSQNWALQSGDRIVISSEIKKQQKVLMSGEFKLPGEYTISNSEKISSVINRAGGFTPDAYLFGAVFIRQSVKTAQQTSLQKLISNLEKEVAISERELQTNVMIPDEQMTKRTNAIQQNKQLIERLKTSLAVEGRIIIKLNNADLLKNSIDDLTLEGGDSIYVPKEPETVNILGEVYNPTSVAHEDGKDVNYYLNKVGGATKNADRHSIYIIMADGSTLSRDQGINIWNQKLNPGDSIIVPQVLERYDVWGAVKDFTTWAYQVTLAAAVVMTALKK